VSIPWNNRYAQRIEGMSCSAIRELLKITENPKIISFAGGLPAPEVFPFREIEQAFSRIIKAEKTLGAVSLQYGPSDGYLPLRQMLGSYPPHTSHNLAVENIIITSGSQQALDLLGKIFINQGDRILVESPTYMGALQAWNAYGAEYITIPSDQDGMQMDQLECALRSGPKFIYVLPNFQNPTGVTLSLERRIKLVELADKFGIPIVEDDPYGQLRFEGEDLPSIYTLDQQLHTRKGSSGQGNVIYLSTFSKILSPGMRLGWVVAPAEVNQALVLAKQGADLHTSSIAQVIAYEVGKDGFIERHIQLIRDVYSKRRDTMLEGLDKYMPKEVQWTKPHGGLFLWVTLPEDMNSEDIFPVAIANEVAYVPGKAFHPHGDGLNTMRLNFSYSNPETIELGISRLGKVFLEAIKNRTYRVF
jgi:2-aminoadipate transaminase